MEIECQLFLPYKVLTELDRLKAADTGVGAQARRVLASLKAMSEGEEQALVGQVIISMLSSLYMPFYT
jgi:predicted ribonuclease YlaK